MLEISFVLENRDIIKKTIENKKGSEIDFDNLLELNKSRLELIGKIDLLNQEKKLAASSRDREKGLKIKNELSELENLLKEVSQKLSKIISSIPNIPSADTPVGLSEEDNVEIKKSGNIREFDFTPKDHFEIAEENDLIDFKRAAKVSGSRFSYIKGNLAKLQFALINFTLDLVTDENYIKEVIERNNLKISSKPFEFVLPPMMVPASIMFGMSRLEPIEDKYQLEKDNLFLIGSAEHSLAPMHLKEILNEDDLPIRYIGYSSAFRREAGSYGKDTKGVLRQHQFDKMEFCSLTLPEKSKQEQDLLVAIQEDLITRLDLPYRVMLVCTGDMGKPDVRQIDIEMWMPGQNTYRETHSADLTGEYQSRRLGIKVKRENEKQFVHLNDATVFAMGRTFAAILENYQQKDGKILIPEVLQKYMKDITFI